MDFVDTEQIQNDFIKKQNNKRIESRVEELAYIISVLEKRIEKLENRPGR